MLAQCARARSASTRADWSSRPDSSTSRSSRAAISSRGDGRDVGKLTQGVTTEILGEAYDRRRRSSAIDARRQCGDTARARCCAVQGPHGFDAWLRAMEAHGISPNVGSFVGAGTIREYGMGLRMGAATGAHARLDARGVRRAMEDGAFGLGERADLSAGNLRDAPRS